MTSQSTCKNKKKQNRNSRKCGLITLMLPSKQEVPLNGIILSIGDPLSPRRDLRLAVYRYARACTEKNWEDCKHELEVEIEI